MDYPSQHVVPHYLAAEIHARLEGRGIDRIFDRAERPEQIERGRFLRQQTETLKQPCGTRGRLGAGLVHDRRDPSVSNCRDMGTVTRREAYRKQSKVPIFWRKIDIFFYLGRIVNRGFNFDPELALGVAFF
jgi:hypothetical protein